MKINENKFQKKLQRHDHDPIFRQNDLYPQYKEYLHHETLKFQEIYEFFYNSQRTIISNIPSLNSPIKTSPFANVYLPFPSIGIALLCGTPSKDDPVSSIF